jgi:hypothetical protein
LIDRLVDDATKAALKRKSYRLRRRGSTSSGRSPSVTGTPAEEPNYGRRNTFTEASEALRTAPIAYNFVWTIRCPPSVAAAGSAQRRKC